jgi:hypothetical protein
MLFRRLVSSSCAGMLNAMGHNLMPYFFGYELYLICKLVAGSDHMKGGGVEKEIAF